MGKNKHKRKKEREKWRKSKMLINKGVTEIEKSKINPAVALEPTLEEKLDSYVTITFKYYNKNECQVCSLDVATAKQLMSKLKKISGTESNKIASSHLIRDSVERSPKTQGLYRGLGTDIRLVEIDYNQKSRIYGYFVESFFSVVAIRVDHI